MIQSIPDHLTWEYAKASGRRFDIFLNGKPMKYVTEARTGEGWLRVVTDECIAMAHKTGEIEPQTFHGVVTVVEIFPSFPPHIPD